MALALVGNPRVAILDEVTTGLDPAARREIWNFLSDLVAEGVTIVLVTHSMEEAQHLCDRVALSDAGRVTARQSANLGGRRLHTHGSHPTMNDIPGPLIIGVHKIRSGQPALDDQSRRQ